MSIHNQNPPEVETAPKAVSSLPASRHAFPAGKMWLAALMVLLGGICISFSAIFVKAAEVSPANSMFYRCFFGGLALLPVALLNKERFKAPPKTYGALGLVVICFSLDLIFWHHSIFYIGPGIATILANFHVFFLAGLGFLLFKENLSPGLLIGLPLALYGLWLVLGVAPETLDKGTLTGFSQAMFAALWYAFYVLSLRHSQNMGGRISPVASMVIISLGCALFALFICLLDGSSLAIPNNTSLLMLLGYGVICQAGGGLLFTYGLPRLPASMGGPLMLVQPALSFIWDILIFNRPISLLMGFGAVLTLASIYMAVKGQMRAQTKTARQHSQKV